MSMRFSSITQQLKDPAIQTRWRVIMPDQRNPMQYMAESVEAVFRGVSSKARFAQAKSKHYPDASEIDALNIIFYETYDYEVTRYLERWRNKIRNKQGFYGMPAEYEKTIYVDMLHYDVNNYIIRFKYLKCWPIDSSPLSLTYEDSSGRIQVNATFRVDDVEIIT